MMLQLAPPELLGAFWVAVTKNNFEKMRTEMEEILYAGYPVLTVLRQLHAELLARDGLGDVQKAKMSLRVAEADKKLVDGASEHFQLLDVASYIMRTYHESR